METIQIIIQIEAGTEGVKLLPEKPICQEKYAIAIDASGRVDLVDGEKAMELMDAFGDNCTSDMIGNSDYIMVYDADSEIVAGANKFLQGACIIMKNDNGLQCMNEEEIEDAMVQFQSRLTRVKMGMFCMTVYELS